MIKDSFIFCVKTTIIEKRMAGYFGYQFMI